MGIYGIMMIVQIIPMNFGLPYFQTNPCCGAVLFLLSRRLHMYIDIDID